MPWISSDAEKHTRKADTPKSKRQWAHVANSELEETGNEGRAVRAANGVVAKSKFGEPKPERKRKRFIGEE